MMTAIKTFAIAIVCGLTLSTAWANPHRLDDSLSYTVPPNVQMQWRPLARGQSNASGMEASVRVNVRIDTREWMGRSGRVYMVLPRDETSSIEAVWSSQGRLQAGRLVSGERALVYAGQITTPTLEDQLQVRLRSNADWQSNTRRLNFHFELDAD
ncbi:hypothetical protein [Hydrogenophaga sp.]|uniref:hypothetical protein n=1 Tax=Hydrogenophaga sp. TaxID=1904254 RepID=UPI002718CEA2|nr:hypothetical protein [Hydrogenophaga sp.]MDO9439136.1 hypothetical protein [Hydrogenophaga sp.]